MTESANRQSGMARLLKLGAASWFILWACAPMMSTPPATPMQDPSLREVGLAAHGGGGFGRQITGNNDENLPSVLGGATIWTRRSRGADGQNQSGSFLHVQMRQKLGCTQDYCQDGAWGLGGLERGQEACGPASKPGSHELMPCEIITGGYDD